MQFIIGDIHGCVNTLKKLVDAVLIADSSPDFVFVGDYIDRGLFSKEVVDFLLTLSSKQNIVCLRGNHDDVVDLLLNQHSTSNDYWVRRGESENFLWWCQNGLASTLKSYGISADLWNAEECLKEWRTKIPEEHKSFFRDLKIYWENETHFACHAYMRPNEELPRDLKFIPNDRNDEALWSRFSRSQNGSFDTSIKFKWDKIGVFGHTPTPFYNSPTPIKYDKIRLIDTGVFLGGYLTAYCCEWDDWILQATDPRDIGS